MTVAAIPGNRSLGSLPRCLEYHKQEMQSLNQYGGQRIEQIPVSIVRSTAVQTMQALRVVVFVWSPPSRFNTSTQQNQSHCKLVFDAIKNYALLDSQQIRAPEFEQCTYR